MHWVRIVKRQLVNLITSFTKMAAHPFNSKVVSNLKQRKHQAQPKALTDEETLSRTETLLHRIAILRIVFHLFSHAAIGAPLSFGFSGPDRRGILLGNTFFPRLFALGRFAAETRTLKSRNKDFSDFLACNNLHLQRYFLLFRDLFSILQLQVISFFACIMLIQEA